MDNGYRPLALDPPGDEVATYDVIIAARLLDVRRSEALAAVERYGDDPDESNRSVWAHAGGRQRGGQLFSASVISDEYTEYTLASTSRSTSQRRRGPDGSSRGTDDFPVEVVTPQQLHAARVERFGLEVAEMLRQRSEAGSAAEPADVPDIGDERAPSDTTTIEAPPSLDDFVETIGGDLGTGRQEPEVPNDEEVEDPFVMGEVSFHQEPEPPLRVPATGARARVLALAAAHRRSRGSATAGRSNGAVLARDSENDSGDDDEQGPPYGERPEPVGQEAEEADRPRMATRHIMTLRRRQ